MARTEQIFIPWIGPSLNDVWRGIHWKKRAKAAQYGKLACIVFKQISPFDSPVELEFQPFVNKRRYDCTNYTTTNKVIEDALVKYGVLKDDGPDQVLSVKTVSPVKVTKTDEVGVLLTISEASNEQKTIP